MAAAIDRHANVAVPLNGPHDLMAAVTPSDSADLANVTRAVYVGGAGDLTVINAAGTTVTFKAVPVGTLLPIRVGRIKATLTTATNLVALW
jgi:hypothetical protein